MPTSIDRSTSEGLLAGFASADITPPIGVAKIGWLHEMTPTQVLDRLYARVCVLETTEALVVLVALDTLSVSRRHVAEIRRAIDSTTGSRGAAVIITATHNHAGPAIVRLGDVPADESYRSSVTSAVVGAVVDARSRVEPAEIAFARSVETSVPRNRRVVYRDGLVRTHGSLQDPDALYIEGPIDPILTTIGVRAMDGRWLGAIVHFTCHPTHHGDDEYFSAGFPGVVAARLSEAGIPTTLFVNGALGNVHWVDPACPDRPRGMDEIGSILATAAQRGIASMTWHSHLRIRSSSVHVRLPFREPTHADIDGTAPRAQRLAGAAVYERLMPALLGELKAEGVQRAEVQAIVLGDHALIGIPAELFVELGLAIKERAYPIRALVAGLANGMVGYVPHEAAFARGGYETTFGDVSKLAPPAGEMLVEAGLAALKACLDTDPRGI